MCSDRGGRGNAEDSSLLGLLDASATTQVPVQRCLHFGDWCRILDSSQAL